HLMDQLGIDSADIGLPGASERARTEIVALAKETTTLKRLRPNMALRTHPADVKAGIEAAQQSGVAIEACAFIGSSPIRRFAEDWSIDTMVRNVEDSVTALAKAGLPVTFVTEDTTRADAETLGKLYETAIGCGAKRICASDTVGHATPEGVRNLLTFLTKDVIRGRDVKLDYHGHNDRGFGTINALAATAIADRVHGCALGIGERVGNTSMDQLLINMQLWGLIDRDLSPLAEYVSLVSEHCGVPVPADSEGRGRHPAARVGRDVSGRASPRGSDGLGDGLRDPQARWDRPRRHGHRLRQRVDRGELPAAVTADPRGAQGGRARCGLRAHDD